MSRTVEVAFTKERVVVDDDSHAIILRLCLSRFYDDQGNAKTISDDFFIASSTELRSKLSSRYNNPTNIIPTSYSGRMFLSLIIFVFCRKYRVDGSYKKFIWY